MTRELGPSLRRKNIAALQKHTDSRGTMTAKQKYHGEEKAVNYSTKLYWKEAAADFRGSR
jgi:hypothetical protein